MIRLFKFVRQRTTIKWHYTLLEKNIPYRLWHWNPYHQYIQLFVLLLVCVPFCTLIGSAIAVQAEDESTPVVTETISVPEVTQEVPRIVDESTTPIPDESTPSDTLVDTVPPVDQSATSSEEHSESLPSEIEETAPVPEDTSATTTASSTTEIATSTPIETPADSGTASSTPQTEPVPVPEKPLLESFSTPTIVRSVTSPILKGTFKSGVIPIVVTFNRSVTVLGTPQLLLRTGKPAITRVDMKSAAGNQLYFVYHIVPGNVSSMLDYASTAALVLNGGSITDASGRLVVVTLPSPQTTGSLSGKSKIIIQTQ